MIRTSFLREQTKGQASFVAAVVAIIASILLGSLLAGFTPTYAYADTADSGDTSDASTETVYRLYHEGTLEHLYTTDKNEYEVLKGIGWKDEKVGWYAPVSGTPVYRLNNAGLQNHLYTSDQNEIDTLTKSPDWTVDYNGQPMFYSGGYEPIYRVYNKSLRGMHHLTTDENEYKTLGTPPWGWTQEGVACYAVSTATGDPNGPSLPEASEDNVIEKVEASTAIEADVSLDGSGTGYHAKLVLATSTAAISYGLQFDQFASGPYANKTMVMVENVGSNDPGNQHYSRPMNIAVDKNQKHKLLITYKKDGTGELFFDKIKVGTWKNEKLANVDKLYVRVEGAARVNNDTVNADFGNIKIKSRDTLRETWGLDSIGQNKAFTVSEVGKNPNGATNEIKISGTLSGIPANSNWDSQDSYDKVSGVGQFQLGF